MPIFCKQCGLRLMTEDNGFFCPTCWETSPRIERPVCSSCGRPHAQAIGIATRSNFPCEDCRDRPNPHIRRVYGAMRYEGAIREAIKLFKFNDKPRLHRPLGELLMEYVQLEMDTKGYDCIVPVPLFRVRERERGFNQSRMLAEQVLPLFESARLSEELRRIRPTNVQSRLRGDERRKNVQGAFAAPPGSYKNMRVLLVDDVATTGSTITECARMLRLAGAASVDVLVVALATLHHEVK